MPVFYFNLTSEPTRNKRIPFGTDAAYGEVFGDRSVQQTPDHAVAQAKADGGRHGTVLELHPAPFGTDVSFIRLRAEVKAYLSQFGGIPTLTPANDDCLLQKAA